MRKFQIIDTHLHANKLTPGFVEPLTGLRAPDTQEQYMLDTIKILEEFNIRAVTSGSPELVQEWRSAAPDRIIPGIFFSDPEEVDLDWIRESIMKGELEVIGEVVTQYEGISPNDPILDPIFSLAEEFDIPVGFHMGLGPPGAAYVGIPKYRASLSNPFLLEDVLVRHPNLRLYVMHAAWPMLDEMIHILYSHPQVYVDVGVINWALPREEFHTYLKRIVQAGFGNRVMFGSDQMIWPQSIPIAIEAVESADFIDEELKTDIFYRNACRFLRLENSEKI